MLRGAWVGVSPPGTAEAAVGCETLRSPGLSGRDGFFEALGDGAFAVDRDGRRVFYPGWFASGFVVPTDAEYQRLRTALVRANLAILAGLFLTMAVVLTQRPAWVRLGSGCMWRV